MAYIVQVARDKPPHDNIKSVNTENTFLFLLSSNVSTLKVIESCDNIVGHMNGLIIDCIQYGCSLSVPTRRFLKSHCIAQWVAPGHRHLGSA